MRRRVPRDYQARRVRQHRSTLLGTADGRVRNAYPLGLVPGALLRGLPPPPPAPGAAFALFPQLGSR